MNGDAPHDNPYAPPATPEPAAEEHPLTGGTGRRGRLLAVPLIYLDQFPSHCCIKCGQRASKQIRLVHSHHKLLPYFLLGVFAAFLNLKEASFVLTHGICDRHRRLSTWCSYGIAASFVAAGWQAGRVFGSGEATGTGLDLAILLLVPAAVLSSIQYHSQRLRLVTIKDAVALFKGAGLAWLRQLPRL